VVSTLEKVTERLISLYGKDVVYDSDNPPELDAISTGAFLLDYACGVGGFPYGRVIEIYGNPSSGKTTVAHHVVKECQKAGHPALYLDFEHAVDFPYAKAIGVSFDKDKFLLVKPKSLEQGLYVAKVLMERGAVKCVVVDSMAAMTTEKEFEDQPGHTQIGMQARALAQAMKVLTPIIGSTGTCFVFINQIRDKIAISGPMVGRTQKTTPGGAAPKFYSSIRVECRTVESLKGRVPNLLTGQMEPGYVVAKIEARITKNKVAAPHGKAWFYIRYGRGIDHEMTLIDVGLARGMLTRKASSYVFPAVDTNGFTSPEAHVKGLEAATRYLREHPDLASHLERQIRSGLDELVRAAPKEGTLEDDQFEKQEEEAGASSVGDD
jgi:recombination protein RecA